MADLGDSTTGYPCKLKLIFNRQPTPLLFLKDSITKNIALIEDEKNIIGWISLN